MKKYYLSFYLIFCLSLWSCSHNPIDDFNNIKMGDDKEAVLGKAGSPLRSKFKNGKDIWTYRFVVNEEYDFKDVVFDNQRVVEIKSSPEVDMKKLEKQEKMIEDDLRTQQVPSQKAEKPKIDDTILNQKSGPNSPSNKSFVPVD